MTVDVLACTTSILHNTYYECICSLVVHMSNSLLRMNSEDSAKNSLLKKFYFFFTKSKKKYVNGMLEGSRHFFCDFTCFLRNLSKIEYNVAETISCVQHLKNCITILRAFPFLSIWMFLEICSCFFSATILHNEEVNCWSR